MSRQAKEEYSAAVPSWFDEVICGHLLGDGSLRMNGKMALLSVQQTHEDFARGLWQMCFGLHLVLSGVKVLVRGTWKPIYYFQTLTMPYFTNLYNQWYKSINGKMIKVLPSNLGTLLTARALAFWIIGDGSWDNSRSRIFLYTNGFTIAEVQILQGLLLANFGIITYLARQPNSDSNRGYIIRIPARHVTEIRNLCLPYMFPSLLYRLGL